MGMANHMAKLPLNIGNAKGRKAYANPQQASWLRLAYLAAFIDGEGTITIARNPGRNKKGNPYYRLHVSIFSTDPDILSILQDWFSEGNITEVTDKRPKAKNNRRAWTYQIDGPRAYRLLVNVFPYLMIKKKQAALGIGFYWLCFKKDPCHPGRGSMPSKELERREKFYWKMRELNKSIGLGRPRVAATETKRGSIY